MKRFFKTYTGALIARFALCSAVPIVVIGVVVYLTLAQRMLAEARRDGRLVAMAIANEFADHLETPRQQLVQAALVLADESLPTTDIDRFLLRTTEVSDFFDALLLVNAQRRVSHASFASAVSLAKDDLLGLDLSRQPFWEQPEQGAAVWTDAFFSVTHGDLSLAIAIPCGAQRLVGIVDLGRFEETFRGQVDFVPHGRLLVLDHAGTVIFHSRAERHLERANLRYLPLVAATLASQEAQVGEFQWEGEEYLGATAAVAATGWVVFYAQPHSTVFGAIDQVGWIVGFGMLAGLGAAFLTAWFLGRRIARHLDTLAQLAEAVAAGDPQGVVPPGAVPSGAVPPGGYQELQRLQRSIETMAETIAERESQLQRRSEYYRTLFHGSSDSIFLYTLGESAELCRFVEVNDLACRRLGYSREALLRLGPAEILDGQTLGRGGFTALLTELRSKGELLFDAVHRTSDGRRLPVEISAQVIAFGDGTAVLAVARDVSERRQAANLIQALYQSTVGVTGDAFFNKLVSELAVWLQVEYVAIALFDGDRLHALQLASYALGELVAPQRYALAEMPCERLLEMQFCHQPRQARETFPEYARLRDLEVEGYLGLILKDRAGAPIGLLGMMSTRELLLPPHAHEVLEILAARTAAEIERLVAEQLRVRSEIRYRSLFDHASDALFLIGGDGRVHDANQVASRYLGCPCELLVGMPWAVLEISSGRGVTSLARELIEAESLSYEGELRSGDEQLLPVWISARLIEIDGEEMVLASARDLTERKAVEREMDFARRAAEEGNATKSRFLANISHEIRTPMNGVIGMLDLTLGTPLDEERRNWLGMARSSAAGLMRVINDLLDLSCIETGKLSFEEAPFDVRKLLTEVTAPFAVEAEQKGLAFSWRIDDGLECGRLGDAGRLRQVLVNLLGNALKFTVAGEVSLRLGAAAGTPTRPGRLRCEVSDSGLGIPAEKLDLLFRPFSQIDASNTRRFGGSGLGLAICREIVEALGGEIGVSSVEGEGSHFFFELNLPLAAEAAVVTPSVKMPVTSGRSLHLLIVEDNPINQRLVEVFVAKRGWTSRSVNDGLAAIEAWRNESFDLILMDVQMPLLDGLETTRRIRQAEVEKGGHVPIIALTAYAMDEDRDRCAAAGMDDFLHKPIHFEEFFLLCRRLTTGPEEGTTPGKELS